MALDPAQPLQKSKIKAGTVLFEAGAAAQMLCLLHKGEITAYSRFANEGKRRFYIIGNNSVPGFAPLLLKETHACTMIASQDSVISAFPVQGEFQSLIIGKLNVGMIAVRSLLQENIKSFTVLKRSSAFLVMIQKVIDNLSIVYSKCNPEALQSSSGGAGDVFDPVIIGTRLVVTEFKQNGGELPEPITQEWLQGDLSGLLKKNYEFDSEFDIDEFNFLKKILALPVELQTAIFKKDLQILNGLAIRLSRMLSNNIQELYLLQDSIDEGLEMICTGEYSLLEKYYLLSELMDANVNHITKSEFAILLRFIYSVIHSLQKNYSLLYDSNYTNVTPSLEKIKSLLSSSRITKADEQKSPITKAGIDVAAILKELSGSPGRIMAFAGIPSDGAKSAIDGLAKLKAMENPLDSGGDARKLRRQISKIYWETYKRAYFKYKETRGNVPKAVRMMLYFGFFDESLLQEDQLCSLYSLEDKTRKSEKFSIFNGIDWLSEVADKKESPSIDEMGLSYFEKLKQEHKDKGWKRESDLPEEYDQFESRLAYELKFFLETNVRLTSGSPATAFPILTKYQIIIPLEKSFVTYQKLSETIDKLLDIDFSAFHREILVNDEERGIFKEFVQQQVIPHFIIVPSIGTKIMMWQDVSGRSKSSHGRIAVPAFATADLFMLLIDAIGAFRWELTKTIKGPDWNNISQSSITADYTDYVQFFRKNRDLSTELKDKIKIEFKRFRSDRDRFVNDYAHWLKYESQGVLKLNKVSRALLYRHIPFAKPIRDNLSNQPAYIDLQNRFKNIRNKKLHELEIRYRKYGEDLPDLLVNNLKYFKI